MLKVMSIMQSTRTKHRLTSWLPLFLVLIAVSGSFLYGWYGDGSKPQSGTGWADQGVYKGTTARLKDLQLPTTAQTHYAVGYSLTGIVGSWLNPSDPFMVVSLTLLLASATLCFLAVKHLFGTGWAVAFVLLLFAWDGVARTFNFSSELFAVPWNNQVLFMAYAFFFWLLTTKLDNSTEPSPRLLLLVGLIAGLAIATREESVIFMIAFTAAFLYLAKVGWRKWILTFGIMLLCYVPQLVVKQVVLGSVARASNSRGYTQQLNRYLSPARVYKNTVETIIYSGDAKVTHNRKALLQAAPWLWVSLVGLPLIIFSRSQSVGLKIFILGSLMLAAFYLSGANMSAHKLQYHCLRYISPSFIALNFAALFATREAFLKIKALRTRT